MATFFWRYVEDVQNYPGWNIAADGSGTTGLREALKHLASSSAVAFEIACTPPTSTMLKIPNNGASPVASAKLLRLETSIDTADPLIFERDDVATLSIDAELAARLATVLEDPDRAFDTSLIDDPILWYWGIVPSAE
ncbi:MAG: hypothetical protein ABI134_23035 [Byssovorax sp.]